MKKKILVIMSVLIFVACTASRIIENSEEKNSLQVLKERIRGPAVGAHQGSHLKKTVNTLEAFEEARLAGADIVEMDLRISKDGVPVVFHDKKLNSKTKCDGKVEEKTVAEIKNCEFWNSDSARISTFEEVLQWSNGRIVMNAEFKDSRVIEAVVALVQKYKAHSWVYFQAKHNRDNYMKAHQLDANIALLYVIDETEQDLQWATEQDEALVVIELHEENRKESTIRAIHAAGKLSSENSWHMGNEIVTAHCDDIFKLGIDIAITNSVISCVKQKLSH